MWIDEPKDEQESQLAPAENPTIAAGSGAQLQPSNTAATGTASSTSKAPAPTRQQFGTIQDYFKGSKQQGERFGEQFTGKLADTQEKQKGTIQQAAEKAKGAIQAGTTSFDEGLVSKAVADPTQVAGNEDAFNKFQQQWNAQYRGPESFESSDSYTPAATAAQKAAEKASQIQTTGGRQQLVQDEFGVYGQGNKGLDEALLQQSSYFPAVQEQAKQFGTIQDYFKTEAQKVNEDAAKAKQTTASAKESTQDAFLNKDTGALPRFQLGLDEKLAAARAAGANKVKEAQQAVSSAEPISDAGLKALGLTREEYNTLRQQQQIAAQGYKTQDPISGVAGENVNFQDYMTVQNPDARIGLENAMSQADYDRAVALAKLTDRQNVLPLVDPTKVGQEGNVVDFRKQDLKDYLSKRQQDIIAARDKNQAVNSAELEKVRQAIEAEKKQNQQTGTTGAIFRTQPVVATPTPQVNPPISTDPVPQINPGVSIPASPKKPNPNVVRMFNEGGEVGTPTLTDYLKRNKR